MNNQAILYSELNLTKSSKKQQKKPKDANAPISTTVQEITYVELNLQNTCQDHENNKKNFHCREKLTAGILGIICIVLMAGVLVVKIRTPHTIPTYSSHCDGCMEDWFSYSNHCYNISTEKKNWTESRMACASKKSSLLIIENDEEMDFVLQQALLKSFLLSSWIGLTRKSTSHDWSWINGSIFKNNISVLENSNPNCGFLQSTGLWADRCEAAKTYICKNKI
ncbi:NKG2-A/NKG2-B type II integral membrane protein-like [Tenrec ecaudatus]|uniref:NKG2-A/NKG2-B type II integral membrane protein-like n=1 Tax=Tenrec ecaudatus TaxID=94439 RepID=UPI003F59EB37